MGVGASPAEIEHELAPRMVLCIDRAGSEQVIALEQPDMGGLPAGRRRSAAGFLHRRKELMPEERAVRTRQRIPVGGSDV